MAWDGLLSIVMTFATVQLDPETSVYFEFSDSGDDSLYFLAVARGLSTPLAHEAFLRELFRSNGTTFDTEVFGSPPVEITSVFPRSELVGPFLAVADRAIENGCEDFWEEVARMGSRNSKTSAGIDFDVSTEPGRRKAIDAYLTSVMSRQPRKRKH